MLVSIQSKSITDKELTKLKCMHSSKMGKYVQELVSRYDMPRSAMINLSTGMFV